ncbi:MAG: hypothetical protein ACRDVE_06620 [Actinocrinis sp.]
MKAKLSFLSGMVIGLLAGSRIGPALYTRVASAVSSLASDERVRKSAATAGGRAAHVAKTAGTSTAHQVRHVREAAAGRAQRFGGRFGDHSSSDSVPSTANGMAHGEPDMYDDRSLGE